MRHLLYLAIGVLCLAGSFDVAVNGAEVEAPLVEAEVTVVLAGDANADAKTPCVEVAFVLDTTGSMGSLIAGAKQKIWFIANQIVSGEPTPNVKMALVPYRDKGDEYVTKVYDLTDNIDQVYTDLMSFQATGGGDTPENVNLALHDAVHKLSWSEGSDTLKIIYLVGDAPPHPYDDVPGYEETAKAAEEMNIIINTILCGGAADTGAVWQKISSLAAGVYLKIDQGGGVVHIPTPHDEEMAALNAELVKTAIVFGDREVRARQVVLNAAAEGYDMPAAAERAAFARKAGSVASNDLLDALKREEKTIDEVDADKLPEEMQKMTPEERAAYVAEKQAERDKIMKQIMEVSAKRDEFIKQKLSETKEAREGFDYQVVEALQMQAAEKGIKYE